MKSLIDVRHMGIDLLCLILIKFLPFWRGKKKKTELPTINYSQIQVHLYTNTMTLSRKCQSSPDVAVYLDNGRIMEKQYIK